MTERECPSYSKCDAMLCPLEPELERRVWYAYEPICCSRKHGNRRWTRKQRPIHKRQTKSWMEKPITFQMLFDASRPRNLSESRKAELREQARRARIAHVDNPFPGLIKSDGARI